MAAADTTATMRTQLLSSIGMTTETVSASLADCIEHASAMTREEFDSTVKELVETLESNLMMADDPSDIATLVSAACHALDLENSQEVRGPDILEAMVSRATAVKACLRVSAVKWKATAEDPWMIQLHRAGVLLDSCYRLIANAMHLRDVLTCPTARPSPENPLLLEMTESSKAPRADQTLVEEILDMCAQMGYCRVQDLKTGTAQYTKMVTKTVDGRVIYTMAHKVQGDVSELIWHKIRRDTTVSDNPLYKLSFDAHHERVRQYLVHVIDDRFPNLNVSDHLFSFRNGIFDIKNVKFMAHTDPSVGRRAARKFMDFNFPVEVGGIQGDQVIDRALFLLNGPDDMEDDEMPAADCPNFKVVLDTQGFTGLREWRDIPGVHEPKKPEGDIPITCRDCSYWRRHDPKYRELYPYFADHPYEDCPYKNEVAEFLCGMAGRMFFKNGEMDRLERASFFMGRPGTGKSTIMNVLQLFFEPRQFGILDSNCEQQYVMGSLYQKMAVGCPELKKKCNIPTGALQSAITGETQSVAIKFKQGFDAVMPFHIMMCGNEIPDNFTNAYGMIRRLWTFEFNVVPDRDEGLFLRIKTELPRILAKFVASYHCMVERVRKAGNRTERVTLPYLRMTTEKMEAMLHTLSWYLRNESGRLTFGEDKYAPLQVIKNDYREWHRGNATTQPPNFDDAFYSGPFTTHGLKVKRVSLQYEDGVDAVEQLFVMGVDVAGGPTTRRL